MNLWTSSQEKVSKMPECKNNYVIGEVLDIETGNRSEKIGYRVGRKCFIDDSWFKEGSPLMVYYPDRKTVFWTSNVQEINQDDYGVWIKTLNMEYRFDNYREEK